MPDLAQDRLNRFKALSKVSLSLTRISAISFPPFAQTAGIISQQKNILIATKQLYYTKEKKSSLYF